jgi:hypothetical protein
MAEVFDLYLALQHANIPVEFIDEDDLSPQGLKPYRVLYVTEPNIPVEGQQGIVDWVRVGGTLATVSGAGQADRYDEPLPEVQVEVRTERDFGRVQSVRLGKLDFQSANGRIRFVLPLGNADIVTLQ